ncbi:ABC transporter substrate-binding protein [Paenibacillus sp. URB8-2]|uniref:ABC transporter substrate-binding protein n=1 Tax=Paenibacillus sp. URB8-2 TaxID=2741301 RepID=UPI0015B97C06|nr:ABC transporter substrate-binding protein [Paenibacillus sp. URB8-2]BCG61642.1 ABC transporter substrate-binding protein [Paenibacillus sp. URB8-2]
MRNRFFSKAAFGILAGLMIVIAGCGANGGDKDVSGNASSAESSKEPGKLVVTSFGGAIEKTQKELIQEFEKEYNAKVDVITLYSADALAKIRAEKNNPSIDVVQFSGGQEEIAAKEDLIMKIDSSKMGNLKDLYPGALNPDGYGPVYAYEALGIIYNEQKITTPPTSWEDLWRPEYKGHVGLVDISNTYGNQFLAAIAKANGGGEDNIQPGLDKIKTLLPNKAAIVKSSPEVGNLFAQEEAWIAPFDSGYAYTFGKQGQPIKFAAPKEGAVGIYVNAQVVKGSQNPELAQKFIDFLLRPESQKKSSEGFGFSPTNKKVELSGDVKALIPSDEEAFNKLIKLDLKLVNANKSDWMERWSKLIAE